MELGPPDSSIKKHKKHPEAKDTEKVSKKRKRSERYEADSLSPTRKHRSKHPSQDRLTGTLRVQSLDSSEASPFYEQTSSLYLPLSPICQQQPLQGLCAEHLSPLILTYYPPLNGVVLSYSNVKLSERLPDGLWTNGQEEDEPVLAHSIDEYAVSYVWVTACFLLFRPHRGCVIEGWINLQNEENIGLVCWNYFNASIERKRLPKEWKWIPGGITYRRKSQKLEGSSKNPDLKLEEEEEEVEDKGDTSHINGVGNEEGHFVDGDGKKVEGLFSFRVKDMDTSRSADREQGFLSIQGTTLGEEEELRLREQDFIIVQGREAKRSGARQDAKHIMSGAFVDGSADDRMGLEKSPKKKHRMAY